MYRYNPALKEQGLNPLKLDCKEPTISVKDFAYNETRFSMLARSNETRAEELMEHAQADALERWKYFSQLAEMDFSKPATE